MNTTIETRAGSTVSPSPGDVSNATNNMRTVGAQIRRPSSTSSDAPHLAAKQLQARYELVARAAAIVKATTCYDNPDVLANASLDLGEAIVGINVAAGAARTCSPNAAADPLRAPANRFAYISLDDWEWRKHARCRTEDPSLFFHPDGERGKARIRRQQLARRICAECPVTIACQEHSIAFQEAFGIWGGLTEDERVKLLDSPAVRVRTHRPCEAVDTSSRIL